MRRLLLQVLAAVLLLVGFARLAVAGQLELVMFDAPDCPCCAAWERDVGVIYHKTGEGRRAPLIRARAFSPTPARWTLAAAIQYSPTFVLLRAGREVARIDGYPGEDSFWGLLSMALSRAAVADE